MQRFLMWLVVVVAAALGGYVAYRCCPRSPSPVRVVVRQFPGAVACPDHDGFDAWVSADSAKKIETVKLAGETTLIPEFHDCQRLIDTTHHYGTLAALWVPQYLDRLDALLAQGPAIAVAVVHAWDGDYAPLGIQQGWNCLVMFIDNTTHRRRARMIHILDQEKCFGDVGNFAATGGQLLEVSQQSIAGFDTQDYPTVGRWDRDQDWARPYDYIGLRCGSAWCEVYREKSDPFLPSTHYALASTGAARDSRRVYEVKGWYDEQFLDVGISGSKTPLSIRGTMIPDPALDTLSLGSFEGAWKHVGATALSAPSPAYMTKLGLDAGILPQNSAGYHLTEESLCLEANGNKCSEVPATVKASCKSTTADQWYAKIQPPEGPAVYKCVKRHKHPQEPHIPGTGRWKWQEDDATQWWRCDQGCCTIR